MAKTKLKKGYKREYYEANCPDCEGLGYREYEAGLIRVACITCQGTGKVRKERRIPKEQKE